MAIREVNMAILRTPFAPFELSFAEAHRNMATETPKVKLKVWPELTRHLGHVATKEDQYVY